MIDRFLHGEWHGNASRDGLDDILAQIDLALSRADIDNWDSLTQMDLVTSLEREYDIVLGIEEIARMESVAQIVEVLKEKGIESAD